MDYDQSFIDKLLPHVKSFAYTWFHLQAAKRKHFKNEDKRMKYDDELRLKQQFENERANVKLKWAVRLLMKLRKDVHRLNQKDLIDVITGCKSTSECVLSNPDMKGKMRRIDCLRQSDKVWRLDLVMVVLFKGIPLESSDGERLDKLPECKHPALCINPNHALLNVRDLEVFLANYINNSYNLTNNQTNGMLYQNIRSPSVFTPQQFLTLSKLSIVNGATEADIKTSLVTTGSLSMQNQYGSDENEDENLDDKSCLRHLVQPSCSAQASNSDAETPVKKKKKKDSMEKPKSNIRINELLEQMEKGQKIGETKPDFDLKLEANTKKGTIKRRRSSNQLKISDNVTVLDDNAITDPSDAPVSGVVGSEGSTQVIGDDQSSHSQQDDEIKELLKSNEKATDQQFKTTSQKDKADLFLKKLLNSNNNNGDIVNYLPVDTHAIKAATPVFELLMSPLFNTILPNSNSNSSSSTVSTNSANSTSGQNVTKTSFNNSISTHNNKSHSPTSFKKAKLDHKTKNGSTGHINTSLINALKFDSNLNANFDELFNNLTQQTNCSGNNQQNELTQQQQEFINKLISLSPTFQFINKPKSRTHTPRQVEEDGDKETSSSPPPPPSIGTSVNSNSITVVPEPTKIVTHHQSSNSNNSHVQMHRPIPMLQKADAVMSSLMSNLNKTEANTANHTNSPIMFNTNSLLSSNSNFFSSYPNISPANCLNGNGSPTSNLFPSISSLFQSPIGTPRVTPTPQQFAAYFLSEDQYHSLILPANGHQDDATNAFNLYQSSNGHMSPLIFNNIINSSQSESQQSQTTSSTTTTTSNSKTSTNVLLGTNN